jgi:hypothetical protein
VTVVRGTYDLAGPGVSDSTEVPGQGGGVAPADGVGAGVGVADGVGGETQTMCGWAR